MSSMNKRMMLALPEVVRLIDFVPIASCRIKGNAVQLRYFEHVKENGVSVRDQLKVLGVPWELRSVGSEYGTKAFFNHCKKLNARVLRELATVCLPKKYDEISDLASRIQMVSDDDSQIWLIRNYEKLGAELPAVAHYLSDNPIASLKSSVKKTLEKVREQEEQRQRMMFGYGQEVVHYQDIGGGQYIAIDNDGNWRTVQSERHFGRMSEELSVYQDSVDLPEKITAPYSPTGDLSIQILNTRAQFQEEGSMMRHCVASYFDRCALGQCLVGSIRNQSGARVATVEYSLPDWEIVQIKSVANRKITDPEVIDLANSFKSHLHEIWDEPDSSDASISKKPNRGLTIDSSSWTGGVFQSLTKAIGNVV